MNIKDRIVRRFIVIGVVSLLIAFIFFIANGYLNPPPGDFATRQGTNFLSDKKYDEAIERFDIALADHPDHLGAKMGKAISLLQRGDSDDAEFLFLSIIDRIVDLTNKSERESIALASAYHNLAILYDRSGSYEKALEYYRYGIITNRETVDGPGIIDSILYGPGKSNAIKRAQYLAKQLSLPEEQRIFRIPEIDSEQRMHSP